MEAYEEVVVINNEVSTNSQNSPKTVEVVCRKRPELVDDFVRNFLVRMNMLQTLDCFQTEWYELKQRGLLKEYDCNNVANIYTRNTELVERVKTLESEVRKFEDAKKKAKENLLKMKKERDFHQMHHRRVIQENTKLLNDIKRLRKLYDTYEVTLRSVKQKYEAAMREKMLIRLQRDHMMKKLEINDRDLTTLVDDDSVTESVAQKPDVPQKQVVDCFSEEKDRSFPEASLDMRHANFQLADTFVGHKLAVSGLSLHPHKEVFATVSDDRTWKLWSISSGENVMSGEGHAGWLADCDFHPEGNYLATASSDTTVKLWDLSQPDIITTFYEHTHVVWGCSWDGSGNMLASCSMDGTIKMWDVNNARCRSTLRGHVDSVNSVQVMDNTLVTCSADKTVCLWDVRTSLCAHALSDHMHSINHVTSLGDYLVSCDSYGIMKLWDVRMRQVTLTRDLGPHPLNRVSLNLSCNVIACASDDYTVKMYDMLNDDVTVLSSHKDSVQSVVFDGGYVISAGSDATAKLWFG